MRPRFDLNLLIALDALLHEKSVTGAALRLLRSQPAMSQALAKLRKHYDDPLLVRVGREWELSPRGRALAAPVRECLARARLALNSQPVFEPAAAKRTFNIMIPDYVTPWLMPPILQQVLRVSAGIELSLERPSPPGGARVAHNQTDLAVTLDGPDQPEWTKRHNRPGKRFLTTMPWVCLVAADHPDVGSELTEEQFLHLPHVSTRISDRVSMLEEVVHQRLQGELNIRLLTQSVAEIPHLIPGTALIALIPARLAALYSATGVTRMVGAPGGLIPPTHLNLVWPAHQELDRGHLWLRDLFVNSVAQHNSG